MASLSILAGPKGLTPGKELTFFYPSTEWRMAQSFECFCGTPSCRGRIAGAAEMCPKQLVGMWLNGYIRDMLEERTLRERAAAAAAHPHANPHGRAHGHVVGDGASPNGHLKYVAAGPADGSAMAGGVGSERMGPTSRELSGEMGGDTNSL